MPDLIGEAIKGIQNGLQAHRSQKRPIVLEYEQELSLHQIETLPHCKTKSMPRLQLKHPGIVEKGGWRGLGAGLAEIFLVLLIGCCTLLRDDTTSPLVRPFDLTQGRPPSEPIRAQQN
jgi:hypothetical protein